MIFITKIWHYRGINRFKTAVFVLIFVRMGAQTIPQKYPQLYPQLYPQPHFENETYTILTTPAPSF